MSEIAGKFGLDLDGAWNKMLLPHLGRHPNAYHNFVLTVCKEPQWKLEAIKIVLKII